MSASADAGRRKGGRKRDPRVEPLVLNATLEVYALQGWRGLTFDAVARASGIGKPAIYRRWDSREQLLVSAFNRTNFPTARDMGGLEADTRDYVAQWLEWYMTPFLPQAGSRILVDCTSNPELDRLYREVVVGPRGHAARQATRRAVARGELANVSPAILPDLILGGLFFHWAYSDNRDDPDFADKFKREAHVIADVVLAGLRSASETTADRSRTDRLAP